VKSTVATEHQSKKTTEQIFPIQHGFLLEGPFESRNGTRDSYNQALGTFDGIALVLDHK
jgi:hypothetical protein